MIFLANFPLTVGGFERLQMAVASAAFHNSAQRLDPPKCHANTREAVLRSIMDWIMNDANRQTWILWLNGAAGAGKSAIARSITTLCLAKEIPVARFFFGRGDPTQNTIHSVAATLVYQRDNYQIPIKYLTVIQTLVSVGFSINTHFLRNVAVQDFGDGGEVYRNQLDRITRYILFDYPAHNYRGAALSELQKHHDISEMLAQIESEKAAEPVLQQTVRPAWASTPPDLLHISRGIAENEMVAGSSTEDTGIICFYSEARGVARDPEVEVTARRILKRSREYLQIPSNESPTETGTSRQARIRAKRKKRRLSSVA